MKIKMKGFSLVELIVAVSILAILSTIGVINYGKVSKANRDSRRIADLNTIKQSLELYRKDNRAYPKCIFSDCNISPLPLQNYLPTLPQDPNSNFSYKYLSLPQGCSGTRCIGYALCAKKEGTKDFGSNTICGSICGTGNEVCDIEVVEGENPSPTPGGSSAPVSTPTSVLTPTSAPTTIPTPTLVAPRELLTNGGFEAESPLPLRGVTFPNGVQEGLVRSCTSAETPIPLYQGSCSGYLSGSSVGGYNDGSGGYGNILATTNDNILNSSSNYCFTFMARSVQVYTQWFAGVKDNNGNYVLTQDYGTGIRQTEDGSTTYNWINGSLSIISASLPGRSKVFVGIRGIYTGQRGYIDNVSLRTGSCN